jgi:hypothetical protein
LGRFSTPAGLEAPYRPSLLFSCNTYLGRFVVPGRAARRCRPVVSTGQRAA